MDRVNQEKLSQLLTLDKTQIRNKLLTEISSYSESIDDLIQVANQKICIEWQYCVRRHDFTDKTEFDLALIIADLLLGSTVQAPVATLSAYLVKYGLEKLCKCD